MVKYNIAVLNSGELQKEGFKLLNKDISLTQCLRLAKDDGDKYIAIQPNSSSPQTTANIRGICYTSSSFNPLTSSDAADGTYEVYMVPEGDCTTLECLKNNTKITLITEIKNIRKQIGEKKDLMRDINIRLYAIENNLPLSEASQKYRLQQQKANISNEQKTLNEKLQLLNEQLGALSSTSENANITLADKNRLLANVNTKIQQSYGKLDSVNSQINTATQDIYRNNVDYERKMQIVKTLKAIVIILFIMILVMIVYFGVIYAQQNYPDSFETFNAGLNKIGFGNNNNPFI